ncbi:protein NRT1/ PTR FAMILY 7.2 isoform X4 [Cinnamomum micranthum f. kanehirae]|uniref:Protein NRT1/ PTR FAMILY 7.2 isoform X4 n=1 Tax=Cinnamomum micranthum f. kanehirae TaxID=337451 RepID=A0A443NH75_9MAGN|nr:protein NRT1/ PTR FAMILY 7.2 isoform X4 [Cinnamomum micranthum f. kanehirae]
MEALEFKDLPIKVKEGRYCTDTQGEMISLDNTITNDGSVDRKGNPAIKTTSGGWRSAILLLVNQGLATLAFFGVSVNLVLFLTRVLQQDNAIAANNVSKWTGTVYMCSLVGAFLSDSYWGRYKTCTVFQIIFVMIFTIFVFVEQGLVLLSLTSWLLLIKPAGCGDGELLCEPVSIIGTAIFYLSIYLIALGNGGYQPSIATFGADQFDVTDPVERHYKTAFFSYFYLALNLGSLFSNTVLVYFEDTGKWWLGFWTATGSAVLALITFWIGTPGYRQVKPSGNPLPRVAQVFVAAARKWDVKVSTDGVELYELEGTEFLDKAATLTGSNPCIEPKEKNPWRLCTVTQVEEAKCVLKLLPIWLCTIIYSVVFTQMASLFVEQGAAMDTDIFTFHIPPASMSAFDILSVAIFIPVYRQFLVPIAARFSHNPKGITELQRMGVGLVVAMLAMVAAGVVELERLERVTGAHDPSSLSIMWQIPQYTLIGISEVFMYVGQLEFFHGQAPDGIKSFGSSLCMASISFGNYVSSLLVSIVMSITTRNGKPGWIPGELNLGHLDRFYFLLAGLAAADFLVYLVCAKWYTCVVFESQGTDKEDSVENV